MLGRRRLVPVAQSLERELARLGSYPLDRKSDARTTVARTGSGDMWRFGCPCKGIVCNDSVRPHTGNFGLTGLDADFLDRGFLGGGCAAVQSESGDTLVNLNV